jgi:hypothetical protein
MHADNDCIVVRIPKFTGYKTLALNIASIGAGMYFLTAALIESGWRPIGAEGAIAIIVLAMLNIVRIVNTSPVRRAAAHETLSTDDEIGEQIAPLSLDDETSEQPRTKRFPVRHSADTHHEANAANADVIRDYLSELQQADYVPSGGDDIPRCLTSNRPYHLNSVASGKAA